jgi:hypothetical protein
MLVVMVQVSTVVPPTCRLSDSWPATPRARTVMVLLPPPDEDELELLELDELLELELLLDEDELLEDDEELLELDELLELLELELLDESPSPEQVGTSKLPSWVPCRPKLVLWPWPRLPFQPQQLVKVGVAVLAPDEVTFQLLVTLAGSLKFSCTVQPLIEPGPSLVTVTFS